jgi:hypothetical protein
MEDDLMAIGVDFGTTILSVARRDANEPNAVDVTTGGETTGHASLDWKSLTSFLTSSASSDLGSMTDEFLALSRTMVPKNMETSLDAHPKLGVTMDVVGLASESLRKIFSLFTWVDDKPNPNTHLDEIFFFFAGYEAPLMVLLDFGTRSITFPPRLFDQPVLMRRQRIFDPG